MTQQIDLSLLKKLKPCVFRYDVDQMPELGDKLHFGFIAQDLAKLFSIDEYGVVNINPHNNKLMVNYNEFIGMLTKWQQQLYSIVEEQGKKIDELERKVELMNRRNL